MLQFGFVAKSNELAETALAIFKGWHWGYVDPDGFRSFKTVELQNALNRLAFCGCDDPAKAILTLLSDGRLTAYGDYQWLYFRNYSRFSFGGDMDKIDQQKWQELARLLSEIRWRGEEDDWAQITVNLAELELQNEPTAEWKPEYNRCSFASYSPETESFQPSYYEEWFSATGIEIVLSSNELTKLLQPGLQDENEAANTLPEVETHTPLSEADLQKWWAGKSKVRDSLTKDELLALVRAKFPDKHISRERIRDLAGARKRGPKGFGG